MSRSYVLGRRNRPIYESNCHIAKVVDKKTDCLLRIIEGNVNTNDGDFYSDISTHDIQYFMVNEGFDDTDYTYIINYIDLFAKIGILHKTYVELEGDDYELHFKEFQDNDGNLKVVLRKKRVMWLSKKAFSKIANSNMKWLPREQYVQYRKDWVSFFEPKVRKISTKITNKKEWLKIPIEVLIDTSLNAELLRYFCLIHLIHSEFNKEKIYKISKILNISKLEKIRLLTELNKTKYFTAKITE